MHTRALRVIGVGMLILGFAIGQRVVRAATPQPTPEAEACTVITVQLLDTLDTAKVHTGDVFRFETIATTVDTENVTVPRNSTGYGLVTYASPAGAHGKGGDLIIEARYLTLQSRGQYQVAIDSNASAAKQSGASGHVSSNVGAVPIPFVGTAVGAFNYFHAGRNAVITAGTRFVVVPVGDLAATKRCSF